MDPALLRADVFFSLAGDGLYSLIALLPTLSLSL